ncbi:MAG: hypothetical protein ACC656_08375 [Candidatus Heimdallarchaeota archaeon]
MSIIDDLLNNSHNILIYIPIISIIVAFGLGFLNLSFAIFLEYYKEKSWVRRYKINSTEILIDKFELIGFLAIIITQLGIIIAMFTGINSAGSFEKAINDDLLEIKVRLTIYVFFLLWTPIFLKLYINQKFGKDVFQDSPTIVSILYLLPQLISVIFMIFITQAGFEFT